MHEEKTGLTPLNHQGVRGTQKEKEVSRNQL